MSPSVTRGAAWPAACGHSVHTAWKPTALVVPSPRLERLSVRADGACQLQPHGCAGAQPMHACRSASCVLSNCAGSDSTVFGAFRFDVRLCWHKFSTCACGRLSGGCTCSIWCHATCTLCVMRTALIDCLGPCSLLSCHNLALAAVSLKPADCLASLMVLLASVNSRMCTALFEVAHNLGHC